MATRVSVTLDNFIAVSSCNTQQDKRRITGEDCQIRQGEMGDKLQESAMIVEIVVVLSGLIETCWDRGRSPWSCRDQ